MINWVVIVSLFITIFMHELAHLLVAKMVGCGVEVFSIGFGPILFKHTFKETSYQIALFPLGGFCKLKGESVLTDDLDAFSNQRYRDKLKIVLAGVVINITAGLICLPIALKFIMTDWAYNLYMFSSISLTLGIMNALPFPALDGSYPFLILLEKFFDRPTAYLYISVIVKWGFRILMALNIIFLPYLIKLLFIIK